MGVTRLGKPKGMVTYQRPVITGSYYYSFNLFEDRIFQNGTCQHNLLP